MERSRNVSESESESAGFPTENRWHIQTRMSWGGTVYDSVGEGTTRSAVGRGPTTPSPKKGNWGHLPEPGKCLARLLGLEASNDLQQR